MFRLLLFAGCGFVAGVVVALWLLIGNRLAWGTTPAYIRENFEKEGGEPLEPLLLFAGCGFVAGVVVALWLLMMSN